MQYYNINTAFLQTWMPLFIVALKYDDSSYQFILLNKTNCYYLLC